MQTLTIDLKKNPDVAALVSDKEPGDKITINASIKSKDDQTLTVTIESVDEGDAAPVEVEESTDAAASGGSVLDEE